MARKSGWQQFADNFNSVYNTFNTVGRNIESKKLMDQEEWLDGEGNQITDAALQDRARMRALADIYTKYGDPASGLALRNQIASVEAADRQNELTRQIFDSQVAVQGELAKALANANIFRVNSEAGLNNTRSSDINATQSSRIANTESQAGLNNARADDINATQSSRIANTESQANLNNTRSDDINATQSSRIANTVSQTGLNDANAARVGEVTAGLERENAVATAESDILTKINSPEYRTQNNIETVEQAQAAFLREIQASPDIPVERQRAIIDTVNAIGLAPLQQRGAQLTVAAENAYRTGGLDGVVAYYDTVDDGPDAETKSTLRVDRGEDGTVSIISTVGENARTLFTASGNNAEAVAGDYMMNMIKNPGTAMSIAANAIALEQGRANVEATLAATTLKDRQAYTEILNQENVQARTTYIDAQVDKINDDIAARGGLGDREKLQLEGYNAFLRSPDFIYMQENNPEGAARVAAQMQATMGLIPPIPNGIDPVVWLRMKDDWALFR